MPAFKEDNPEAVLAGQIAVAVPPKPEREYKAIPGENYRFDFAWPDHKVLVEVQGGTWMKGKSGHTSGRGIERDTRKLNLAVLAGWRVLQVTTKQVKCGEALSWIMEILK